MVNRMIKRGVLVAPAVVAILWVVGDSTWALSSAIGLGLALLNLVLAARIIGGVAQHTPHLLLPAALIAFALGLALLVAIGFGLQRIEAVDFPVMGMTLIGSHLGLVLWEAAGAYAHVDNDSLTTSTAEQRS